MFSKIQSLKVYQKYKMVLSYLFFSAVSAVVDALIGMILVKFQVQVLVANSIGVLLSTVIHYILVTKKTFASKVDLKSVLIYLATFLLGLLIQNLTMLIMYNYVFITFGTEIKFLLSKVVSLGASFFAMYFIRKRFMYIKTNE